MRLRFPLLTAALAAMLTSLSASALEFPLPPEGEDVVGEIQVVEARYEDTFADIAKVNDLGYQEMVDANPGIDPWVPGAGRRIVLPTRFILPPGPREGIVINLAEYRLYYFPQDRPVVYTFPLGIGREGWNSPIAETRVTGKIPNPTWTPPASIHAERAAEGEPPLPAVVPAGPDNPLGPFKFTLGLSGYLIHGSNKKFGIGMRVSHGCFRMLNNNVLQLAELAPVGTPVRIINQPYKFGVSGGKVWFEPHTPLDDHGEPSIVDKHAEVMNTLQNYPLLQQTARMDWDALRDLAGGGRGIPEPVAVMLRPVQQAPVYDPFMPGTAPQQAAPTADGSALPLDQVTTASH